MSLAVAGVFAGSRLASAATQASAVGKTEGARPVAGDEKGAKDKSAKSDKHVCKGMNSCKGKGGCSSGDSGCAGKNSCKGKGGCASADVKHSCKGMNACKGQGGCKTGDASCAGKNSCKGKGGCQVPVKKAALGFSVSSGFFSGATEQAEAPESSQLGRGDNMKLALVPTPPLGFASGIAGARPLPASPVHGTWGRRSRTSASQRRAEGQSPCRSLVSGWSQGLLGIPGRPDLRARKKGNS